jgi:hypothetical protein
MNGYAAATLWVAIIMIAIYLPFRFWYLEKVRSVNQKYALFAARDSFVYLLIKGDFDRDLDLYNHFCWQCNALIRHTKEFNLNNYLAALRNVTESDDDEDNRIANRIEEMPDSVRESIKSFYRTVTCILIQNSTLLRVLIRLRMTDKVLELLGAASEPLGSKRLLAVKEYRAMNKQVRDLRLQPS